MAAPIRVVEEPLVSLCSTDAVATAVAERRSAAESVVRGAFVLVGTQPLTWLTSLAAVVIIPHYLGASGLGAYAVAVTLAAFVGALSGLGMPGYLARSVAKTPERAGVTAAAALVVVLATSCIAALATVTVLTLLGSPLAPPALMRIALMGAVVVNGLAVVTALLRGRERHAAYALCTAGGGIGGTWAGLVALAAGGGAVAYLAASVAVGAAMAVVTARAAAVRVTRAAFDRALLRVLVIGGLPFMGWEVIRLVRAQIDVVLIAALLGTRAAGWLSAAYSIVAIPIFIPTLVTTPLLPALSRSTQEWPEFRRAVRGSLIAVLALTLPASAGICALAPEIPHFLHWPADMQHAAPLMVVLAWQQPLVAADMVLGTALFALNRERRFLAVLIVAAVFNPLANGIGVPLLVALTGNGVSAAPPIEIMTEVIMLAGAVVLLPRGLFDRALAISLGRIAFAVAALYAVTATLGSHSVPAAVVAGAATYGAAVLVFGLVRPDELRGWCGVAQRAAQRRRVPFGR